MIANIANIYFKVEANDLVVFKKNMGHF